MTIECHDEICITCSDQLLEVTVIAVDATAGLATGIIEGATVEVGIELVDDVEVGDVLLCHGGVALQRGTFAEVRA
jgi:hydrogenase maturation factor